ncbi:AraC family transcriptional regulator [Vibrio natriegens]|uniref:helix-turn-helix domain-containing protein n=1 Tax=Vibrio natriegens TaxID=691 RepID=UPI001EFD96F2|nr:helix-turn-helix domain-containing protein [Vibrio natriegens]MCG9700269.1 AraC family transcriptional regulator [Vibrio natriegens]
MERLVKACWIGGALSSLPEQFRWVFTQYFELLDHSNDISVISDKEFNYFFYYATDHPFDLLQSVVTLCENLDKKLIVVYTKGIEANKLPPQHVTAEYYALDDNYLSHWLSQIKLKYFFNHSFESSLLLPNKSCSKNGKANFSEVVDYISNNIHRELREEDAAALCHYSTTYFSKVFRRKVGMCFRDYVTAKRIALAKKMLTEDNSMKIAYIAYQCGYHDVSYFSRIFKKKTGFSPASYRQQF